MDQIQSVWCNNQGTVYILGQYCSWLLLSFSTLISFLAGLVWSWVVCFSNKGYKICLIINIIKRIFWILRIGLSGSLSGLQKSEFLKLIISFLNYFWYQHWDQGHKMSGKKHQYFFDSNYFQLLLVLSTLQKSEFLKLIIAFFHYFGCQNWDQWHKMSGKNTHTVYIVSALE